MGYDHIKSLLIGGGVVWWVEQSGDDHNPVNLFSIMKDTTARGSLQHQALHFVAEVFTKNQTGAA